MTFACAVLAGCHGSTPAKPPTAQAALQEAISALPGVTSAHVRTERPVGSGPIEKITVGIPEATIAQFIAVVDTINRHPVTAASDATPEVALFISDKRSVAVSRRGRLESRQIADDVQRLRRFAAAVSAHKINCHRGQDSPGSDLTIRCPALWALCGVNVRRPHGIYIAWRRILATSGDHPPACWSFTI